MGKLLSVDPWLCIITAAAILLLPVRWIFAAFLAAFIHEMCHIATILALGGRIHNILVGIPGAVICMESMEKGKELISAAAGPTGSVLLLSFSEIFPELALCGLIQGGFNLLPIYPMDGGRILECLLTFLLPDWAEMITGITSTIVAAILAVLCIHWRFLPGFLIFTGLFRSSLRKIPCKERKLAVQ